jgi:hypothetical protein
MLPGVVCYLGRVRKRWGLRQREFSVFSFQFSVGESERSTLIDDDNEQVVGVPLATPVAPVRSPAEN